MSEREYHLHDGKKGAALAVRVIPRARNNEVVEILNDGTIKIRLASSPDDEQMNEMLIGFLSQVLNVSPSKCEIVAGETNRSKLVSILDLDSEDAHKRILESLI